MRPKLIAGLVSLAFTACGGHAPGGHDTTDSAPGTTGASEAQPGDTTGEAASTSTSTTVAASTGDSNAGASGGAGTSTSGEATSEAQPVCGNGVLEADGFEPEDCDDGNLDDDDGCNALCARDRKVFVSSILYKAGDIKSLYLADAKCANMASNAGFPEPLKFRAWLSDSETDAVFHIKFGRGRVVLVNGIVVADSWLALITGEMQSPIEVTEKSETYHGGVWTGTRPDGLRVPDATHCDDWSTSSFQNSAYYGYSDRATPEWTLSADDDNPIFCLLDFALYCFEGL